MCWLVYPGAGAGHHAAPGEGVLGPVCTPCAIVGHVLFTLGKPSQIPHICSTPMSTGDNRLELPHGVTGKLQIGKTGASGSQLCYKLLVDKPVTVKMSKIQKGRTCLVLVRDSGRLERLWGKSRLTSFWCDLASRTANLSDMYHIVVKKHPNE